MEILPNIEIKTWTKYEILEISKYRQEYKISWNVLWQDNPKNSIIGIKTINQWIKTETR